MCVCVCVCVCDFCKYGVGTSQPNLYIFCLAFQSRKPPRRLQHLHRPTRQKKSENRSTTIYGILTLECLRSCVYHCRFTPGSGVCVCVCVCEKSVRKNNTPCQNTASNFLTRMSRFVQIFFNIKFQTTTHTHTINIQTQCTAAIVHLQTQRKLWA